MKNFFGLMVLLIAFMLAIPTNSFALTEGDWEYVISKNEITITGYRGDGGAEVIPDTIRGCPVTKIESLKGITGWELPITSLHIPDTVREIGAGGVSGHHPLSSVNVPASLTKVGDYAFSRTSIVSMDFSGLSQYVEFGKNVFERCENLKSCVLPNDMTEIPDNMFIYCEQLEEIDIPGSVTRIGKSAFLKSGLKKIELPISVKEIGKGAFSTTDLTEVIIPYGTEKIEGDNYGWDWEGAFGNCNNLMAVYIPDTVIGLWDGAFEHSDNAIIYCTENSYAASVCEANEISYLVDNSVNTKINVIYNGSRISFHEYGQNPEAVNGRTMVPLRSIFESMGAKVEWDNNTFTATAVRGNNIINIKIGENCIYKNGDPIHLDVPAQIMNGRTMVPVRVIAEAFGANVEWRQDSNMVLIKE